MVPFLMMGFLANVVQFLLSGPAAMARWTRMALVRLAGVIQVLPDCLTAMPSASLMKKLTSAAIQERLSSIRSMQYMVGYML